MTEWSRPSPETLISVGDAEVFYDLEADGDQVTFVWVSRGHRTSQAWFDSTQDAVRYLVYRLADNRLGPEWLPIEHADFAPDTAYDTADSVLRWPGGQAVIRGWINYVREFSWLVNASPADIAASYLHPNGEPLFDLGVRYQVRTTKPEPGPARTQDRRPLEQPPPDPTASGEYADLDVLAVDNDWQRRPTHRGDVFAYGSSKHRQGRVVSYRGTRFHYQSYIDDTYRKTVATFPTAAAARRFLAMELGAIWRQRQRGLPALRVSGPPPGRTVIKNPTEFEVSWGDQTATFTLGPIGQQQALTFSWCAEAAIPDIAASYRDPAGRPLFPAAS
jgi:hypothetical protein